MIPLLVHPARRVGLAFLGTSFVLAVTLRLAHCVEEAEFSSVAAMSAAGRTEWAHHQVETTVDFAPRSRLLTWCLGGPNFQIEHHLFSRVCHIHYPALAPIVRDVCSRNGVPDRVHPTQWAAVLSHARWLRRMGRGAPLAADPALVSAG